MNNNFFQYYPKASANIPPPAPTRTVEQIRRVNTLPLSQPMSPPPQPMLPPPPPPQPIPDDRNFWFRPMVSKERVAGAPDWLRPVAEFATELTTPFDLALTLGTAGLGPVIAGGRGAVMGIRGGLRGLAAVEGRNRAANLALRGAANVVEPATFFGVGGARGALPARVMIEGGMVVGGHALYKVGEDVGGIPGGIVGALGGGILGGAAVGGLARGMGKAVDKTPGLKTFFEDPWNGKKKVIDNNKPTELTVSENASLTENIETITQQYFDEDGLHFSDAEKVYNSYPEIEKGEVANSIFGEKGWKEMPTKIKNTLHRVGRLWNPTKHFKSAEEKLHLVHTVAMAMATQESNALINFVRGKSFSTIFGEIELDVNKNNGMFIYKEAYANGTEQHALFTPENIRRMKELGIDPENLSDTRIFDEVNPLITRSRSGESYKRPSPPSISETGAVVPRAPRIKAADDITIEIYGGEDKWGKWNDILNLEQKQWITRRADAFEYTNHLLLGKGIDVGNRGAKVAMTRDQDLIDVIDFSKEELDEIAKNSIDSKELSSDDYNAFKSDLINEQGYSARTLWTKKVKGGDDGEIDIVIIGKDKSFGYKLNGRTASESSRKFSRVRLAELEDYRYVPASQALNQQLASRLKRVYSADFNNFKLKALSGYKYVDGSGDVIEVESVLGPYVTGETRRRRAIKILIKDYGPKKLKSRFDAEGNEIKRVFNPKYLEKLVEKYDAGERIAMPYPIANRNELRSMIKEIQQLKNKLEYASKEGFVNVFNFSKDEVDLLKTWAESSDNSALNITKLFSDPDGEHIIQSLHRIRINDLNGKSKWVRIFDQLPFFKETAVSTRVQSAVNKRIEAAEFAVVLAHARRIMGVDYVNQEPLLLDVLNNNTINYNFPAAKKMLQKKIKKYIKDVDDNTMSEITVLRNQLKQLETTSVNVDPQDIPTIASLEGEITRVDAEITKRLNLQEVWKKAGRPKNLQFDSGQDYVTGMSYGANGWNPTGEGYTTGNGLHSIFQFQKELDPKYLEDINKPPIDIEELKYLEELMDTARDFNFNYTLTRAEGDNLIQALGNTSATFKNTIKQYETIIDNALIQEARTDNIQELLLRSNTDFLEGLTSTDPGVRKDFIYLKDLQPDEFGEYDLEKIYFGTTREQMIAEGIPITKNEEDVFLTINDKLPDGTRGRPLGTYDLAIETVKSLDEMVKVSNIEGIQKWWLQANSMQRMVALGIDASVLNIHLLPLWFNHPGVQKENIEAFWKTFITTVKDVDAGEMLVQNYKASENFNFWKNRYKGTGLVWSESNEVFQVAAELGWPKAFERIGKPFELAFARILDVAGLELLKALDYLVEESLPAAEKTMRRKVIAEYVNDIRGLYDAGLKGISPKQANIESSLMLAGRYRRAIFGIWAKAFTGKPFEKYMAQKALINLFTGLVMTTMAIQIVSSAVSDDTSEEAGDKLLKLLDPTGGDFLLFSANNQKIGPGSKFVSDARILTKAMNFFYKTGTQEDMEDWENFLSLSDNNPGMRWVRAQLAYSPSTAWDFFTGENYIGEPQFREGETSLETIGNYVTPFTEMVTPLWLNSTFFENTQGNQEWTDRVKGSGTRFLSEIVGLRAHPQGAATILREASWDIMNAPYANLEPFEKDILRYSILEQISPLQEQTIKRGTNDYALYFNEIERIEDSFQNELLEMTKLYPNTAEGNRNMYDRYRQLKSYVRGQKYEVGYDVDFNEADVDPKDLKKVALSKYFAMFETVRIPGTQLINWDQWEIEYENLMNSLTLQQQAVIARNTSRTRIPYQFLERIKYLGEAKEYKRIMKAQELRELYLTTLERPDLVEKSKKLYLILED